LYNGYIPGPKGAYERSIVQVPAKSPLPPTPVFPKECDKTEEPRPASGPPRFTAKNMGFDLGDLLLFCIVLLILLDCEQDDQLSILLTAAAFLF